jgi:hypothetical protein
VNENLIIFTLFFYTITRNDCIKVTNSSIAMEPKQLWRDSNRRSSVPEAWSLPLSHDVLVKRAIRTYTMYVIWILYIPTFIHIHYLHFHTFTALVSNVLCFWGHCAPWRRIGFNWRKDFFRNSDIFLPLCFYLMEGQVSQRFDNKSQYPVIKTFSASRMTRYVCDKSPKM